MAQQNYCLQKMKNRRERIGMMIVGRGRERMKGVEPQTIILGSRRNFCIRISLNGYKLQLILEMKEECQWLREFLTQLSENNVYEEALAHALTQYELKSFNLYGLTSTKILNLYNYLQNKFYNHNQSEYVNIWFQNQLRVFIWVLICYSYTQHKSITSLDQSQWTRFSVVFNGKNPDVLQFQSKFLIKSPRKAKKWTEEEAKLLSSIVSEKEIKNKWSQVAKSLFLKSNKKYFRTPKQCRQHWINHLDPNKLRTNWTLNEDFQLIKHVIKHGKKWSKISKEMKEMRTEHMVKNRFKSLMNLEKKRLSEELDEEILIKKIYQRLQSCQSLKQLQAMKRELKKMEEIKMEEKEVGVENSEPKDRHEWKWEDQPQLEVKHIPLEFPTSTVEKSCINFFFEEPSFPSI